MRPILSMVQGPESLKHLTDGQLKALAAEVREVIIEEMASTGGALSSALGAVELAIALHAVFDVPRDKLVLEGGHLTPTHTLLAGRTESVSTLHHGAGRREEGAAAAISEAAGFAEARALAGEDYEVVAVVDGDAVSAGVALEGLAQAARLGRRMLIVLNDRAFAPASRTEALSAFLSRMLAGRLYTTVRQDILTLLRTIPGVGARLAGAVGRAEEAARGLLAPGRRFHQLGLDYLGPVKGHTIRRLRQAFETTRALGRPVLVHVVTRRGTGYRPSEQHPDVYDAIGPFDPATGRPSVQTARPTYAEAFAETLLSLAEEDPSVVAITAGVGGLKTFAKRLPKRFYDVGGAAQHAVAFAAGLARQGLKAVVAVPSEALQRGFDQVLHAVCLKNLPVTFAVEGAGLGDDGGRAPHGAFDLSTLRLAPNMVLMAPKDEGELASMLEAALELEGPVALVYPRGPGVEVERDGPPVPLEVGRAELVRPGRHVAIWACGPSVRPACDAAERLAEEGVEAFVVNARFVKPIDNALLCEQARQVGVLVTVEENALAGGFGSAVLEVLEMARLPETTVHRIGLPDRFVEPVSSGALRRSVGLDAEGIAAGVRRALQDRPPISLRHARGSTR